MCVIRQVSFPKLSEEDLQETSKKSLVMSGRPGYSIDEKLEKCILQINRTGAR